MGIMSPPRKCDTVRWAASTRLLHKGHPPVHAAVKSAPHKHPPHLGGGSSCVRGGWYNQAKTPKVGPKTQISSGDSHSKLNCDKRGLDDEIMATECLPDAIPHWYLASTPKGGGFNFLAISGLPCF